MRYVMHAISRPLWTSRLRLMPLVLLSVTLFVQAWIGAASIMAQAPFLRVEPPHWWVRMKHNQLQLMLYGRDFKALTPIVRHPGVSLSHVDRVSNQNYLFLTLRISQQASPGRVRIQLQDDDSQTVESIDYPLLERSPGAADRHGFDSSDVIYLITPDRFSNGDTSNDTVLGMKEKHARHSPGGRHGGDIAGIVSQIDYLHQLGVTALWLNPVLENDMKRASYHGYSITDFYRIDRRLGTNQQYQQLGREARRKGIKLIMDMIANHCGAEHWWMSDLPSADWINGTGRETASMTNHRRTTLQDPHASAADRNLFQNGWFVSTMPDLNQRHPLLATYLMQNSVWWIEYADLSGIRMDTVSYADPEYTSKWSEYVLREYPRFTIVGEEWSTVPTTVAYWQANKENADGFQTRLTSLMDFPGQVALRRALTEPDTWNSGWLTLYETLAQDAVYPDPQSLVVFADNHDMSRLMTQVEDNLGRFRLGLTYVLTTRGIPQLFYGTEIGMSHTGTDQHTIIRSDFPGGWPDDEANAFTGVGLTDRQAEIQAFVRRLLKWRKKSSVIHNGRLTHFAPQHQDGIYVYFRWNESDVVMVIMNKNEKQVDLRLARFRERLESRRVARDVVSGETYDLAKPSIPVPPNSALILEVR